jgi:hypothetical protein
MRVDPVNRLEDHASLTRRLQLQSEANLSIEGKDSLMNGIDRLIIILLFLSVMEATTYSQMPVKLNGSEGMALLQSLTKSPLNLNNTSMNATNSSANLSVPKNASSDFDSWGTKPKNLPAEMPGSQAGGDYLNDPIFGDM